MNLYIPVIGMEVHVELKTKSKMFCACKNNPDETEPNKHICPICLAQPGTLPTANKQAIISTVLIGKSLGCTIAELSKFDRKHYFYPDLPKGYQISQYDKPIAEHGQLRLRFILEDNIREEVSIGIRRVHLEEDTAKLLHGEAGNTLVDFNRAGIPLVEIVTDPDFKTPVEAKKYCQELQMIFRALNISDADMEKGQLRCEANISLQEAGRFEIVSHEVKPLADYQLNQKVELKNLNSFRAVEKAILYEIERQTDLLKKGETWEQQTRGWDENKGETIMQRRKENAEDYRYFPEPDIPPFHPKKIAGTFSLPELPQARRQRFHEEYGFSYADASLLTSDDTLASFTEAVMSEIIAWVRALPESKKEAEAILLQKQQKLAALAGGWLTSKLIGLLNSQGKQIKDIAFTPENFAELMALVYTNRINSTNAYKILVIMVSSTVDHDPTHIMEDKGWGQVADEAKIGQYVARVMIDFPDQAKQFQAGKEPILKFFIGLIMKASEGSADPKVVEKLLREQLKKNDRKDEGV